MLPKLTLKQRKFWKCYCETHNLAKSAKFAGSQGTSIHSLSQAGWLILNSLELSMPELLNAQGLTDEYAGKVLSDGLQANKVEIATFQGKIRDEKSFPDFSTRGKYLEIFHRLRGNFIDRHELTGRDGGDFTITVSKATRKGTKTLEFD